MNTPHVRALARLTFGNLASQVYLAVVAVVAALVAYDTWFVAHEDASFAFVGLFAVAAPAILLFFAVGSLGGDALLSSDAFVWTALVLSVLIQSLALGALLRLVTAAGHPRPHRG
ncbi:SCO4225 family membrane protein [Streptomyces sp. NPDC047928]|uniref:SCO4225 family membrane protein n=1 Tax=unclassified Streptomyces TaxID=2593676 RepID=UPI00371B911B